MKETDRLVDLSLEVKRLWGEDLSTLASNAAANGIILPCPTKTFERRKDRKKAEKAWAKWFKEVTYPEQEPTLMVEFFRASPKMPVREIIQLVISKVKAEEISEEQGDVIVRFFSDRDL